MDSQLWLEYSGSYKEKPGIDLPLSKSISNRVLILSSISSGNIYSKDYSDATDTQILQNCLSNLNSILYNSEDAGTAFRFLTALAAIGDHEVILSGSDRMKKRPIKGLVDAIQQLGAKTEYIGEYGFPPLKVKPSQNTSKSQQSITINDISSSQFVSALMLIAAKVKGGLEIHFPAEIPSYSYIQMTSAILSKAEIEHELNPGSVIIPEQNLEEKSIQIEVEKDWSGTSYFYSLLSAGEWEKIRLKGLSMQSIQKDSRIAEYFRPLGIVSEQDGNDVIITKTKPKRLRQLIFDFKDNPDLAMTVIVAYAINKIDVKVKGIENLVLKESNRIVAIQKELGKINVQLEKAGNFWQLKTSGLEIPKELSIDTYDDHRIAMAFSIISAKTKLIINNPDVVNKSFPNYWKQLEAFGINTGLL